MRKHPCWMATAAVAITLAGCGSGNTPVTPSAVIDSAPPQSPVGLRQNLNAASVRVLTWNPNSEPDLGGYQIYQYSPDPSRDNAYVLVATLNAAAQEWPLPTDVGTVYTWVRMRAVDQFGNRSAESAACRVAFQPTSPGSEPPDEEPGSVLH